MLLLLIVHFRLDYFAQITQDGLKEHTQVLYGCTLRACAEVATRESLKIGEKIHQKLKEAKVEISEEAVQTTYGHLGGENDRYQSLPFLVMYHF